MINRTEKKWVHVAGSVSNILFYINTTGTPVDDEVHCSYEKDTSWHFAGMMHSSTEIQFEAEGDKCK